MPFKLDQAASRTNLLT